MIKYIQRNVINVQKYNACIATSLQNRVYAYSWYLDIVAENWSVLVYNDYEAVMPLPWRKKYGLPYVYTPFFVQQLGVFSKEKLTAEQEKLFLKKIPFYFVKVLYQLHSEISINSKKCNEKYNYILALNTSYEILKQSFRKDRKYRINQAKKKDLELKTITPKHIIEITNAHYAYLNLTAENLKVLKKLIEYIEQNEKGFLIGVYKNNEILGGCFFIKEKNRITYLYSVMTPLGKNLQAPSFVINSIIERYSNTNYILDFEGSMVPGIASFYKSFGAVKETYPNYETTIFKRYL